MKVINIKKLSQCKNIIKLNLNTESEFDTTFISGLKNLKQMSLPAFPSQREFIINEALQRKDCHIRFNSFNGHSTDIELQEVYKDFEINKYNDTKDVTYGIFMDISESVEKESNNEVESYVKKLVKKSGQKRKFSFDSEAENFCVYANKLEDLKWLIDLLCEYIKKYR